MTNRTGKAPVKRTRGRRWMFIRKMVLDDDPICQDCGLAAATEVDHIKPLHKGGTDDRENLQALCEDCHKVKTRLDKFGKVGCDSNGIPLTGWE